VSTGNPQPLQRYTVPIATTVINDSSAPYSFNDWYNSHQFVAVGQEYQLYNTYLINWYQKQSTLTTNTSVQIQLNYLALLKQLQIFFSKEETENWYNNVDITNTKELLLSIPYFAKKLKEISVYYLQLRKQIKETRLKYNQVGSEVGINQEIQNYILDNYTQKSNSLITLPATIWNKVPALSSVKDYINIQIEELYDSHSYFDQSPTLPTSDYYDINNTDLLNFLTTKGLTLSSTNWIYNLGVYSLSADPLFQSAVLSADPIFQNTLYNNILAYSNQLAESYIGQNKYSSTTNYALSTQQDTFSVQLQRGNNTWYWPGTMYKDVAKNYPYYRPQLLVNAGIETLGTGGSSIDLADTIFVQTTAGVQGAWLQNKLYDYVTAPMVANLNADDKTVFIYPFPGYGLSAEDVSWTGVSLSSTPQFTYLNQDAKQAILNTYWTSDFSLSATTTNLKINDTSLIVSKALPSINNTLADTIRVRNISPDYNNPTEFSDGSIGAWLYKFTNTDISIAPDTTNIVVWPFEQINTLSSYPAYYPTDINNACSPVAVSSINVNFAIAGNALSSADVIYKVNNYQATPATALQCCWLSGYETIVSLPNSNLSANFVNQSTLQYTASSGTYTRFIWNGEDGADPNAVFLSINHQPDCKFVTTPNTTYKDYSLCTCNAVLFSPFGQPGNKFNNFNDFIIQDTSDPGSLDLTTWTDFYNKNINNTINFMWFQTNSKVGWGDGQWVSSKDTPVLRQGNPYIYYRACDNDTSITLPEYVARYKYDSTTTQPIWIQAKQDPSGNWSSTDQVSRMIISPGDILLYSRAGSTSYDLIGYQDINQDVSETISSIWSNFDYMSIGLNSVGISKTFQLAYPSTIYANPVALNLTDPYQQYPAINYTNILNIVAWSLSSTTDNTVTYFYNTPTFSFTPTVTGLYYTSLTAISANGLGFSRYASSGGSQSVGVSGYYIFNNIPPLTAIPSTTLVATTTSYNTSAPGYVLNTPLVGWNYGTFNYSTSSDINTSNIGARPYWGKIYDQKNLLTDYKGIQTQGTPLRLVDSYNILTQPEISDIVLRSGLYFEYTNKNIIDINWNQTVNLATYVNTNTWCTLNVDTTSTSNLGYQLNNITTEAIVTPTNIPSNIVLQNYIDTQPVEISYNAVNPFVWDITATPVDTFTVYSNASSLLAINALEPWTNFTNQIFPTVAAFPAFDSLYSTNDSGEYFIPSNLGMSVYVDQSYTASLSTSSTALTGLFEDVTKTVGVRGFSKQDQPTPYTITLEDNSWLKENSLSNSIAGNIQKDVFKRYQNFIPYQSTYETNPNNKIGIILPNSRQTPWGGYQDSQWTDTANRPTSFAGVDNVNAWYGSQILKQNGLQLDNWVTDIFGNQYGLYKNIQNVRPALRKYVPGQIWTRNNLQYVSPATTSLTGIFNTYSNISSSNLYKDLTGGNVYKIDTFFDILYVETSSCVILDKVNYDFTSGTIYSTPDISRGLSLAIPVTSSLVREFNNYDFSNSVYATMGDTWFFPDNNRVILSVCGLSGFNLTPELYQYDITNYTIKKIFPNDVSDVSTINELSSLSLSSIQAPILSYNNLTSQYLLAILSKDINNNDNLIEIVIENVFVPTINTITVYVPNSATTIVDPPAILQNLYITLSTNTPFSYTLIPDKPASSFVATNLPSWATFTTIPTAYNDFYGNFNLTTPSLTGLYNIPFYVSNNIGPAYYTLTLNVTSQ
jgi:hypothetical protein